MWTRRRTWCEPALSKPRSSGCCTTGSHRFLSARTFLHAEQEYAERRMSLRLRKMIAIKHILHKFGRPASTGRLSHCTHWRQYESYPFRQSPRLWQ